MKRIAVIGAGGHAKVAISVVRAMGLHPVMIFDDDVSKKGNRLLGVSVAGPISDLDPSDFDGGVIAIGSNANRKTIASHLAMPWIVAVHPNALVHETAKIGAGTVIFAGAVIQPDSVIGEHVIVNTGVTIDHDCEIGDFAHLAPGVHLAGDVHVGANSFLGIGAVVVPGIRIGHRTTVGAGAAVVGNIPDDTIAYGVPAKAMHGKRSPAGVAQGDLN